MYEVRFYENAKGDLPVKDFLAILESESSSNRDARIQHQQITHYIQLLCENGTRLGENFTKHLEDEIWELRPGCNRVLFFYFRDDTFVLLHAFRKRGQKTPHREIERAKAERADWISRMT